ncbi:MAG: hypothetical protein Ta2D_13460 [Rickettsiales bacterium]|nr:MAG: hypothetical protein Ta2D_13460 [Rickettsiales bacterium]
MKKNIIISILIILFMLKITNYTNADDKVFENKELTKHIEIRNRKNKIIEQNAKIDNYNSKYYNYVDAHIKGQKCQGYNFEPEKLTNINFIPDNYGIRYVILSNHKIFFISDWTDGCDNIGNLSGENVYKQLLNNCRFILGATCMLQIPTNCKKISKDGLNCFDEDIERDYQVFQYECTNKGCIKLDTFTEYGDPDVE